MTVTHRLVTSTIKTLTALLCRIDAGQLARVPERGPLILVANHINFLEVPVLYPRLQPRPVASFAKAETRDTPGLRFLADLWGAIPIRRGEPDLTALRQGLAALQAGYIVAVAPEGTRSGHGRLQRGHPGVVLLALRSGAPLLPMACYGAENYRRDWRRLRRADFHIVVGQSFHLRADGVKVTRAVRQQMTGEIMYQLAALLPPAYRGDYANLDAATEIHLRFPPSSQSNIRRA
ncbi:MAG: 1-acyl-sn-glycerol-3-phosphate acyltransferase [Chloroflexi bacterium]|nr:1-acyl-sn-glycerol-3-phosphate acyltransferase [Chloroflexota bacterium]